MRLANFMRRNREPILAEWEEFAKTCVPAGGPLGARVLRDHAGEMLIVIADDLSQPQAALEQNEKSKG